MWHVFYMHWVSERVAGKTSGEPLDDRRSTVHLDKQFILDELKKEGQSDKVQKAIQELPEKVDHEQHAQLLSKLGLDPGKLAAKAAEQGISKL